MSEIEAYLEAREAFLSANKAVDALRDRLLTIVRTLQEQNRATTWIHGPSFSLPPGAQASRNSGTLLQEKDFPTAQECADVLSKWHHARHLVLDKHKAIPERFRSQVQTLPEGAAVTREKR
jgi:hypothetical protein